MTYTDAELIVSIVPTQQRTRSTLVGSGRTQGKLINHGRTETA